MSRASEIGVAVVGTGSWGTTVAARDALVALISRSSKSELD